MNKMSRHANTKSGGAINFKAYAPKWKKTKLHIRLIRSQTRSSIHTLIDITSNFFYFYFLVTEFFRSLLLSFSPALDEHNPDVPEWREDIGRVVRTALSQVHHVPTDLCWKHHQTSLVIIISYLCAVMAQKPSCYIPHDPLSSLSVMTISEWKLNMATRYLSSRAE